MFNNERISLACIAIILIAITHVLCSCNSIQTIKFTEDELKWFEAFDMVDTAIFISTKNEVDTIVFIPQVSSADTTRSFELGFYNENYLSVPYILTAGSYHQFAKMGDGKREYQQNLFNMSKSSSGRSDFEVTFLGTIFNGKELENVERLGNNVYFFDSKKATYVGMNVEAGKSINDFTFSVKAGITNFTDERNIVWRRK